MRISRGILKNTVLTSPLNKDVRPISSRVKDSVIEILSDEDNCLVWELFAGSGIVGFELASIGAASVVFFDNNPDSIAVLKKNLGVIKHRLNKLTQDMTLKPTFKVIKQDLVNHLQGMRTNNYLRSIASDGQSPGIIFCDPPYELTVSWSIKYLSKKNKNHGFFPKSNGLFVLKVSTVDLEKIISMYSESGDFSFDKSKIYNKNAVVFFRYII